MKRLFYAVPILLALSSCVSTTRNLVRNSLNFCEGQTRDLTGKNSRIQAEINEAAGTMETRSASIEADWSQSTLRMRQDLEQNLVNLKTGIGISQEQTEEYQAFGNALLDLIKTFKESIIDEGHRNLASKTSKGQHLISENNRCVERLERIYQRLDLTYQRIGDIIKNMPLDRIKAFDAIHYNNFLPIKEKIERDYCTDDTIQSDLDAFDKSLLVTPATPTDQVPALPEGQTPAARQDIKKPAY